MDKLVRNQTINWQIISSNKEVKGVLLITFDTKTYRLCRLNSSAAAIWILSNGKHTKDEIISKVLDLCEAGERQYKKIFDFIEKLISEKLLEMSSGEKSEKGFAVRYLERLPAYQPPRFVFDKHRTIKNYNWNKDFIRLLRKYGSKNQLYYPQKVTLDLTTRCNLGCVQCYHFENEGVEDAKEPALDDLKRIIDKIDEAHVPIINLFAAEPLMRKDLPDLLDYIHTKGIKIVIKTNGTLITPALAKVFKKNDCDIHIGLDGATPESYKRMKNRDLFDKIIDNIQILKKEAVPVSIHSTVTRYNFSEIVKMYSLVKSLGITNLALSQVCSLGRGLKNEKSLNLTKIQLLAFIMFRTFFRFRNQTLGDHFTNVHFYSCNANTFTHIDLFGNIKYCMMISSDFKQANIYETNLLDAWHSESYESLHDLENVGQPCSDCFFIESCEGMCQAISYGRHNDFYQGNEHCLRGKISQRIKKYIP